MHKRALIIASMLLVVVVVGVAVVGVVLYRVHAVRMSYIPPGSGSMMNTFIPGDRVLTRALSGEVKRGHLVIFKYPGDDNHYLCRVIGLPNETIELRDTSALINGRRLNEERVMVVSASEPYDDQLKEVSTEGNGPYRVYYTAGEEGVARLAQPPEIQGPHRVPANSFFLLADNRDNSEDSRYRGPVPRELIQGEVWMIYYSTTVDSDEMRWNRWFKRVR
jgi:signal peptidase I